MKKIYCIKAFQMRKIGVAVAAVVFMAGCASTSTAPVEQMAVSKAAVGNASSDGGNEFAPLQLKSATDKLAGAERAMTNKDYVLARRLAEQAQVDAQLAGAMARSAKAQKAADALQDESRVLRQEIDRKTK